MTLEEFKALQCGDRIAFHYEFHSVGPFTVIGRTTRGFNGEPLAITVRGPEGAISDVDFDLGPTLIFLYLMANARKICPES